MTAKMIAVIGATGQQGGSVAKVLSKDGEFKVRAVIRNPADPQAQALKKQCPNVALARADLTNKDSVVRALEGAWGCFVVTATPYGDPIDTWRDKELLMGKNIVDACKQAGVSHAVISTVDPGIKMLQVPCPELDTKMEIFEYAKSQGLIVTGVMMSFYYENLMTYFKPQKRNESEWGFVIPLEGLPWAVSSVGDLGEIVKILFQQKDEHVNKIVPVVAEHVTLQQMIQVLNKYLSPAKFVDLEVSVEQFGQMDFPGAPEAAKLFEINKRARSKSATPPLDKGKQMYPSMLSFDQWVQQNKGELSKLFAA